MSGNCSKLVLERKVRTLTPVCKNRCSRVAFEIFIISNLLSNVNLITKVTPVPSNRRGASRDAIRGNSD